jgi:phenylpyruvate tautomerase PptA (4-oxalocrotonate tautomerase family)
MPLIRISLLKGKSRDYIGAISDGVHRALVEAFGIPPDDLFQIVEPLDRDNLFFDADYLGQHRSEDVVFVHIFASTGRDTAQKKRLYAGIVDNLAKNPGLRREDVMIVLTPNTREDWSFGGGLASYVRD